MKERITFLFLWALAPLPLFAAEAPPNDETQSKLATATHAVTRELKRYVHDGRDMAFAPAHWTPAQWTRFAEGAGAVAAVFAADRNLYDEVQRHRTSFTNDFAKTITPFGAGRALDISALMIIGGAWSHNDQMRDAGRDSLESEILAGGIVTTLLKRAFGRARPIQEEGARSFHPFSSGHQSFPSGHATNAFAFATGIAGHYDGWVVPTIVYTIATGVAASRVNDRAHFPSDVLAGALIGRAVAKGVVYRHQHGRTAWIVSPMLFERGPGIGVRITSR